MDMEHSLSRQILEAAFCWHLQIYFRHKPTGVMIPTHLKVLTIVEEPFVEHVPNLK